MWNLLVALCLSADAGVPPSGLELKVWRAAAGLPTDWKAPADFDFATEQLASEATRGKNVVFVVPSFERFGDDLFVSPPLRSTQCPPCRGIQLPSDVDLNSPVPATRVYRLPRTRG